MKKELLSLGLICAIACGCNIANATTLNQIKGNPATAQQIMLVGYGAQQYVNEIGFKILNANKIQKHIIFDVYRYRNYPYKYNDDVTVSYRTLYMNRTVLISDRLLANASSDDEVAALMAHEIAHCLKSYSGMLRGSWHGLVYAFTCKKQNYEADKFAIEMLVNAGYNPNALITILTKTAGQYRFDIGENALTTKRIREIHDYIATAYPDSIKAYAENPVYQNAMNIIKPAEKNQNWKYYSNKMKQTTKAMKKKNKEDKKSK